MSSKTAIENTPESEFEHAKELCGSYKPKKQQEAIRIFEKLAAQDHSEACYALGCLADNLSWCYTPLNLEGEGIDLETYWFMKAFELFKKEAENGILKSQTHLAEMYAAGCGTKKDSDKAAYWQNIVFEEYLRLAEAGDAEKQRAVAEMYKTGCIVERDMEKAAYWHNKYSEHADADTLFGIALEYLDEEGFKERNSQIAETLFLKSAETADERLLYRIGLMFIDSYIMKPKTGFNLLQKSAEMGYPDSKLVLSRQYLFRNESSPDICKMRQYLGEVLHTEGTWAYLNSNVRHEFEYLGKYYHDRAEYYLGLARGEYNYGAAFRIALRLLRWNPCNPPKETFSILEELASFANIYQNLAEFTLGCLYSKGLGTEKDEKIAAEWFLRAAEHDDVYAQIVAGALYLKGIGVEKDPEKAAYWLKKVSGMDGSENDGEYLIDKPYLPSRPETLVTSLICDPGIDRITSMKKYIDIVLPWFTQEAEKGNAAAQLGVGLKLLLGQYRKIGFPERLELRNSGSDYIKKAADQDYAPAQYQYGRRLLDTDKNKAMEYIHKSAENGCTYAQNFLKRMDNNNHLGTSRKRYRPRMPSNIFRIEADEFPIPEKYIMKSFEEEEQ